MVDTNATEGYKSINGLTPQKNRELNGVSNPPRPAYLKTQLKYIQDNLDETIEETNDLVMKKKMNLMRNTENYRKELMV